jgi:arylsulfatase A-like enzyme
MASPNTAERSSRNGRRSAPTRRSSSFVRPTLFAAYTAYTDHEIGRVIQEVEDEGKFDNTLVIYISGDNGNSAEGSILGTPNEMAAIQGVNIPVAEQLKFYDVWGSDQTTPHFAVGWTWAFDTPFKWTKQVASHFGGTRQGMAISWPGHITDVGGIRTQFHHMIDIVPTILEAASIQAPVMVNGVAQKPIEGVSMAYTFDKANANAPSTRSTQYFEMVGNRAIYALARPAVITLSVFSRSVFHGLRSVPYHARTHFTQLRQLGHVVLVDPLGVVRLNLDCLL